MNQKIIGCYITQKRRSQNLTQDQLAEKLGVRRATGFLWGKNFLQFRSQRKNKKRWKRGMAIWRRNSSSVRIRPEEAVEASAGK